jgi:hypothetical protein
MIRYIPPSQGDNPWFNLKNSVSGVFRIPRGKFLVRMTGHNEGKFFGRLILEQLQNDGTYRSLVTPFVTHDGYGASYHAFGGTWNGNENKASAFTIDELFTINLSQRATVRARLLRRDGTDLDSLNGLEVVLMRI